MVLFSSTELVYLGSKVRWIRACTEVGVDTADTGLSRSQV